MFFFLFWGREGPQHKRINWERYTVLHNVQYSIPWLQDHHICKHVMRRRLTMYHVNFMCMFKTWLAQPSGLDARGLLLFCPAVQAEWAFQRSWPRGSDLARRLCAGASLYWGCRKSTCDWSLKIVSASHSRSERRATAARLACAPRMILPAPEVLVERSTCGCVLMNAN